MLKTIFFDCDGVIILKPLKFTQRFSRQFEVPENKILPFFQNEYQRCKIGQADLKQELKKYLPQWGYKQPVEDLLKFWFEAEKELDKPIVDYIASLKAQGLYCFIASNNEKYRAEFLRLHSAISTVFDRLFFSCEAGFSKTQPEFWKKIYDLESMGNKHEVLVVDDNQDVIDTAKKFGFFTHFYNGFEPLQTAVEELLKV